MHSLLGPGGQISSRRGGVKVVVGMVGIVTCVVVARCVLWVGGL